MPEAIIARLAMNTTPDGQPPLELEYATGERVRSFSDLTWMSSVKPSLIAAGVGLAILGAYAVTGWGVFPILGAFWFVIGGLLTLAALVLGVVYAIDSVRHRDVQVGLIVVAIVAPLANFAVSLACVVFGARLMEYWND